ncbi:TPA: hypothetical protein JBF13_05395 [Legionella pneumophila]|nr:hypothetical protein [Legionella pneumophila]
MISYNEWQPYIWKNEIDLQLRRIFHLYNEMLDDDFNEKHNPMDCLDRAIVIIAFSIRRMVEKKLITDMLANEKISVHIYKQNKKMQFRKPYYGHSGESAYINYDFDKMKTEKFSIRRIANEIIHSSQFMFVKKDEKIPDGLLIASDKNMQSRVIHLTFQELDNIVQKILNDNITYKLDRWDSETGRIDATRE